MAMILQLKESSRFDATTNKSIDPHCGQWQFGVGYWFHAISGLILKGFSLLLDAGAKKTLRKEKSFRWMN